MISTATKALDVRNQLPKSTLDREGRASILVVNDVEETRDGLEELLTADGYDVDPSRSEEDAVRKAGSTAPDLILMSLSGSQSEWIAAATRIREKAHLKENTTIILFGIGDLPEGVEVRVKRNIYLIQPEDFNQLRECLKRLLNTASRLL